MYTHHQATAIRLLGLAENIINSIATKEKTAVRILAPVASILIGATLLGAFGFLFTNFLQRPSPFQCPRVAVPSFGHLPNETTAKQNVAQLDEKTRQLFQKNAEYKQAPRSDKSKIRALQQLALERKQRLVEVMNADAGAASLAVLLSPERADLGRITENCVEHPVKLKGRLEVLHADLQQRGTSINQYRLVTDQGRKQLHFINGLPPGTQSGATIELTGLALDDEILLDGTASLDQPNGEFGGLTITPMTVDTATTTPTVKKTLAILANFSNTNATSPTVGQVEDVINNQVDDFYRENSYNRLSYDGTARGWFTVTVEQSCYNFWPESDLVQGALQEAKKADPNLRFSDYSQLLIIAPLGGASCPYGGFGVLGSIPVPTPDGVVTMGLSVIQDYFVNLYSVGHEFGHNLGNHHAAFLYCGATTLGTPPGVTSCPVWEYGDLSDIMGASTGRHFNAIHKDTQGWLTGGNLRTITTSGRYTLEPIETATSGLKALKIRRGRGINLWLEYRQPIGYDAGHPFQSTYGLGLRLDDAVYPAKSFQIDPTPPTDQVTASLSVGQSFTDPMTGTTITTVAQTPTDLTVDVTVGVVYSLPNVQLTSPLVGATVTGTIPMTATADDEDGIDRVEFYAAMTGRPPQLIGSDTTAPYEVSWDTGLTPNGPNYLYATAIDQSGASASTKTIGVNVDNVDPTPPTDVAITQPASGVSLYSPVTVTATASEDRGIYKIEFLPDGCDGYIPKCGGVTVWQLPYAASIQLWPGAHTVRVRAYNMVGGRTTSADVSFTVLADTEPPTISIINPVAGSYLRNTGLIAIRSSDNIQVDRIEWWIDEQSPQVSTGSDLVASIDSTAQSDGEHTIMATAYDSSENSATASVTFIIDNTAPTISLIQPADGATVSKVVTIVTSPADAIGIQRVDFYRDGNVLLGTQTQRECKLRPRVCGYMLPWNTKTVVPGTHTISAKAVDLAGNEAQSGPIAVFVSNGSGGGR